MGNWTNKLYDYVKIRQESAEEDKLEYINGKSVLAVEGSNNHLNDITHSHMGLVTKFHNSLIKLCLAGAHAKFGWVV